MLVNGFPARLPNCIVVHWIYLDRTHDPSSPLKFVVFGLLCRANHAIVFTRSGRFRESDAGFLGFTRAVAVFCACDNGKI